MQRSLDLQLGTNWRTNTTTCCSLSQDENLVRSDQSSFVTIAKTGRGVCLISCQVFSYTGVNFGTGHSKRRAEVGHSTTNDELSIEIQVSLGKHNQRDFEITNYVSRTYQYQDIQYQCQLLNLQYSILLTRLKS